MTAVGPNTEQPDDAAGRTHRETAKASPEAGTAYAGDEPRSGPPPCGADRPDMRGQADPTDPGQQATGKSAVDDLALTRYAAETRSRGRKYQLVGVWAVLAAVSAAAGMVLRLAAIAGATVLLGLSLVCVVGAAISMAVRNPASGGGDFAEGDPRAIGYLLDRLDISFAAERTQVERQLVECLRSVQPWGASALTVAQRDRLLMRLRAPDFVRDRDVLVAILEASGVIGDEQMLQLTERIAYYGAVALSRGSEKRVREAARDCLPALRARISEGRMGAELLRASSAAPVTPADLMRAADGAPAVAPEELLRAGDEADGERGSNDTPNA